MKNIHVVMPWGTYVNIMFLCVKIVIVLGILGAILGVFGKANDGIRWNRAMNVSQKIDVSAELIFQADKLIDYSDKVLKNNGKYVKSKCFSYKDEVQETGWSAQVFNPIKSNDAAVKDAIEALASDMRSAGDRDSMYKHLDDEYWAEEILEKRNTLAKLTNDKIKKMTLE